jgi:hypothetical protein
MSGLTRRQLLQSLVGCATTAGTVVLARTVLTETAEAAPATTPPIAPDERADLLVEELGELGECTTQPGFLNVNGAFRNNPFRNNPFSNSPFRNGLFNNGRFYNSPFRNGLFRNGAPYMGSPTAPPKPTPTPPPKTTPPPG